MSFTSVNKNNWNKRTEIHFKSEYYNVEGFMSGACSLKEIELSELGNVENKKLLHLQCHFGLDSLSWARRGAKVTGVDFSEEAIKKANYLKETLSLDADFICSDIYEFGSIVKPEYDIVFTSYGAICWLRNLQEWAHIVAKSLKNNGIFYMVEFHPFYDLKMGYPYFYQSEPARDIEGTYTENSNGFNAEIYTWTHSISDVINSLIQEGIVIEHFNEFPYSPCNCFEQMEEREPGKFYLDYNGQNLPLVYSVKGIKQNNG